MFPYTYKIINSENQIISGTIRSVSKIFAKRRLSSDGSSVIMIMLDSGSVWAKSFSPSVSSFKPIERIMFFRNLSMMMDAGLPLAEGLEVLHEQINKAGVRNAIDAMTREIMNGQSLSKAMRAFPEYFTPYIVEMIRVGELTGTLTQTLERIADDLEKDNETRQKVIGAIAYPLIVFSVMISIALLLMLYVLPKVQDMFKEVGVALPPITAFLLSVSAFMEAHPIGIFATIIFSIAICFSLYDTKKGKYFFHFLALRIPIFGELIKEANLSRFFRSMNSLIGSSISIDQAVEISEKTLTNAMYKEALEKIQPIVRYGVPLTEALKSFPFLFPMQTCKILGVGEKTGKVGESLERLVTHYDRALSHKAKMITSLVEPILMGLAGLMVGVLALSIFMPLYQMANVI